MSVTVEVDTNGDERVPFDMLRAQLIESGKKFSDEELDKLVYYEIMLACMAHAGTCACTYDEALRAKMQRRKRFVSLPASEVLACKRYLMTEGMWEDVWYEVRMRDIPHWDDLTPECRLMFKAACLENHTDLVPERIKEMREVVKQCRWPIRQAYKHIGIINGHLHQMLRLWKEQETASYFLQANLLAEYIFTSIIDPRHRALCNTHLLRGYQCTAGCFRLPLE